MILPAEFLAFEGIDLFWAEKFEIVQQHESEVICVVADKLVVMQARLLHLANNIGKRIYGGLLV